MRNVVEVDRAAIWKPIRSNELKTRVYSNAYPYKTRAGVLAQASVTNPIYRYVRNFRKFNLDFSLFMFTNESDPDKVSKFFDSIVKKLKKNELSETIITASMSNFTYSDFYEGSK